jgi:uncharacterized membrane protein YqiK
MSLYAPTAIGRNKTGSYFLTAPYSAEGSLTSGIIAMRGEAGFQPDVVRGGVHFINMFQHRLHMLPLVTVPQGSIGYVFARDGLPLEPTQTLAAAPEGLDFQSVREFMRLHGQRGPQRQLLREGTYAINLVQFVVFTQDRLYYLSLDASDQAVFQRMAELIDERDGFQPLVIQGADDMVGIVTVHDGPALAPGEIIAPIVGDDPLVQESFHNNFQDCERFLHAAGRRGRQLQVLCDGTYFINRLFATVELVPKTMVEVGYVGVVVSFTGDQTKDLSGDDYKHGELVSPGGRGVWSDPLLPGKYAFNTYAGRVIQVPTTNFILKWNRREIGSHKFDENLSEVSLITRDAFEPSLPLSVVVHIDYRKAPLVIQRFGDIKKLVEQTLDPMVAAYFKNVGQTRTLIQLLQDRSAIQLQSSIEMKAKFAHYNLELEEVLIGTPGSTGGDSHIEQILTQLRARQIAEEQIETYNQQQLASVKERELREAESRARQQARLTESELSITVQGNQGKAEYQRAVQQAAQIRALSEAEAQKIKILGEAEAERTTRLGLAQSIAIEEQVRAYGSPRLQMTQQVMTRFAEAIEHSGVDIVPRILIGGAGSGGAGGQGAPGGSMEALMALLLSEKMNEASPGALRPRSPEVERLRAEIQQGACATTPSREILAG